MIAELSDRRAICALRLLDAPTGQPLPEPFLVSAPGAGFVRNRLGYYVLTKAPGFERYTREWESPPAEPAPGSVRLTVEVRDPLRRYLPRRVTLSLPRDPDPQNSNDPSSLFQPVNITMFPSTALAAAPNWAVVQATVLRRATSQPVAGALLRVLERLPDGRVLGRGLTGPLGEALVAAAGLPRVRSGDDGDVLVTEIPVTLEALAGPDTGLLPDPEDLEARRAELDSNTVDLSLAAGRIQAVTVVVPRENP